MVQGENIDLTVDEERIEFKPIAEKKNPKGFQKKVAEPKEQQLVSCLRNEVVTVRFLNRETKLVNAPNHVLSGGMAETAVRVFTTPSLRNGTFKNVLTDSEKEFLEAVMRLEPGTLSVYNRQYWNDIKIRLLKQDNYLNLSIAEDYIKYKCLLGYSDLIAPNTEALTNHPKVTYEFVIISQGEEQKALSKAMTKGMQASMLLGTILENKPVLLYVVSTLVGRPIADNSKLEYLQGEAYKQIQLNPTLFIKIVEDEMLESKVFLQECTKYQIIKKRGDLYFYEGKPLSKEHEDPTLNIAVKYINRPENQQLKLTLEAKLKSVKE